MGKTTSGPLGGATGLHSPSDKVNRARFPEIRLGQGEPLPSGPPVLWLERPSRRVHSCEVFDSQGRLVMRLEGAPKSNCTVEFPAAPLAELHLGRGRFWAREPVSGAHVSFLWPGRSVR